MTLIEVILAALILGILAVALTTALFYPRYLVITSALEQSAIHAGTAEIERHLFNHLDPAVEPGVFETDGRALSSALANITTSITTNDTENIDGDPYTYLVISNSITYRDGKTVEMVTYRSLMISPSERRMP